MLHMGAKLGHLTRRVIQICGRFRVKTREIILVGNFTDREKLDD